MTATVSSLGVRTAGGNPTVRVGSGTVTILLDGNATAGAFALFVEQTDPGGSLPYHTHDGAEEAFYILDGHFEFVVGELTVSAGPGDFFVVPRGVPHLFRNLGTTPGRKLGLTWPAGLDRFFLEVGQPVDGPGDGTAAELQPTPELLDILAKYGMRVLPPPAPISS